MAVLANLTTTPVPGNTQNGAIPGTTLSHVRISPAGGAGTYTFNHNLQWTPLFAMVVPIMTQGSVPVAGNAATAFCVADTTSTLLAVNLPASGIFDVVYC